MKTDNLKFSIITPSYNQGEYIKDTIESVLNQNYGNFEHIIIDGGSTDNTIEILKRYKHLIWVSEKDRGQAHAINKGFDIATGDIITWINSDDYYEKNIFQGISDYFTMHPECMVLYGDIIYIDKEKNILNTIQGESIDFKRLVKCPDIVRQPSTFMKREIIIEFGGVNEQFHIVMDLDLFLRVSKYYIFHYYQQNISYYRYYSENKSLSLSRPQIKEIYKVFNINNIPFNLSTYKYFFLKYIHSFGFKNRLKKYLII